MRWGVLGLSCMALLLGACGGAASELSPEPAPGLAEVTPGAETVEVGHAREMRGLWVSTVSNLDWPSRSELTVTAQKAELRALLDTMQELNLNTVLFQVRPAGDAVYASSIEPWSRSLTGTAGADPGWDPLPFLIDEAHARNIEVHAWFNPYRAGWGSGALGEGHMGARWPEHLHRYGEVLWMDPGAQEVQDRAVEVILDVAQRYEIDGVHLDDYFYPYPNGTDFPDERTWAAYRLGGGELSREDWRRENVHTVVRRIHEGLEAVRPEVRFGISPFGIYRPQIPEGVRGLDAYAEIYADPLHWVEQGWVDYLTPQLYWPTTAPAQPFEKLLSWWGGLAGEGREIYAGHALHLLPQWSVEELRTQVALTREVPGAAGQMWFRARFLLDHPEVQELLAEVYPRPALTSPLPGAEDRVVEAPALSRDGSTVRLAHAERDELRAFAVYRWEEGWVLDAVRPARAESLTLEPGRWAVSAVDRWGAESRGTVIEVGNQS